MATKKELQDKKDIARLYFMQGETRRDIAERIGVSDVTVGKWAESEQWDVKRAAVSVSRPELVNKLLRTINTMLDNVEKSGDPDLIAGLADKLSKFASVIEKLDKKATVVNHMETFMALNKWLEHRQSFDKKITPELIRTIAHYQDLFISEQIAKSSRKG